jgi:type IV secretion system protein VirD4
MRGVDATGLLLLASLAVLAVGAGAALIGGGYFTPWQFAALAVGGTAFLVVGLPARGGSQSTIAKSKWADHADLYRYDIAEDDKPEPVDQGPYLGKFADQRGPVYLRYKGVKHLLCFGPTGSGKSMSIMVPNIQNLPRSQIVVDVKGELATMTWRRRSAIGKTIVLNPFGVLTKNRPHLESVGWNPLLQLDPRSHDFEGDAMCIADALVEKSSSDGGSSNGKFFDRSAQNLVQALVMWERLTNGDNANLRDIPTLLNAPDIYDPDTKKLKGGLTHTLQRMAASSNYVIENAANSILVRLNDKNSQSTSVRDVADTLKSHFAFINDKHIAFDMARGDAIDFSALHRQITTIYLILPVGELKDQAKWLRMFVNLSLRKLYKSAPTDDDPPTLPSVLYMLDEFGNIGRLEEIVKALNMVRSYRIQLMFFLQNIGQLTGSYKAELASFFSGAGAVAAFKTGALDMDTAEHLAKAFGTQEIRIQTEAHNGGSFTPHAFPLIRAEDISRLDAGKTINLIEPCPWPIIADVPVYTRTRFRDGLDPNPYYHG